MQDLANKVALITGGASGIGLGMAEAFLAAGMKVALGDVNFEAAQTAARSLDPQSVRALAVDLDVTSPTAWSSAVGHAEERLGPVQILCNNAGVTSMGYVLRQAVFEELTLEEWNWTHDVNITGLFHGVRTILPRLRRSGLPGHIVNTSSMAGLLPFPGMPPSYTSSKFAVLGFSEQLRADLNQVGPKNVGVSVLFPGHTRTQILETSAALSPVEAPTEEPEFLKRVRERHEAGVSPRLMGERVLRAIRANEFYIVSHPEYKPLIERRFQAICAAIGDAADPTRSDPMPAQV